MLDIINVETFVITSIILALTPGLDTIYILSRSISQGKKSGIISTCGISSGIVIHIFMAAFGLSIILANSKSAFFIIKIIGSIYLIYLGIKSILNSKQGLISIKLAKENINYRKIYLQGLLTNLLNPKVALFFLGLLPQFVRENPKHLLLSFLTLGGIFITIGTIWCLCLVIFATFATKKLQDNVKTSQFLNLFSGVVFILLGLLISIKQ
jgi:threonine/homoserine/homoserine lactone efflux protein